MSGSLWFFACIYTKTEETVCGSYILACVVIATFEKNLQVLNLSNGISGVEINLERKIGAFAPSTDGFKCFLCVLHFSTNQIAELFHWQYFQK